MVTYETFTYKGKDYKFKVGRDDPKLEEFVLRDSDYYKEKQKNLSWVSFVLAYPILVAVATVVHAAFSGEEGSWGVVLLLMLPYIFLVAIAHEKESEARDVLKGLKERAEQVERIEAYGAWIKDRSK